MWTMGLVCLYRHPREGGGPVPLQTDVPSREGRLNHSCHAALLGGDEGG